ncbi:PREDICTED: protein CASC3-like isoform X2 [Atta colombica]|uniref:protein CASC3-like isoform X2 n=1 Tax=Atta colombica TaxID=520822 RepID=UPI00084C7C47|nr:PREDICTED: protein CASC3-like isoform X2 [Atta colombica]
MSDTRRRRKSNQSCGSDDLSDSYEELNATKETQSSEQTDGHQDSECDIYESDSDAESQEGGEQRESGDGQEEEKPQKKLDDDEDRRNPQYIPKRGTFYEHDDRTTDEVTENNTEQQTNAKETKEKKVWKDKEDRWDHDRYNDEEQAPKRSEELIATYGYDIRNEEGPPRARRRRRYGRGPNKYTRNWEDEDAYGKTTTSRGNNRRFHKNNEDFPALGNSKNTPNKVEEPVISSAWYSSKNKTQNKTQNFPPLQSQQDNAKTKPAIASNTSTSENKTSDESTNTSWKKDSRHITQNQNTNGNTGSGDAEKLTNTKPLSRENNKRNTQESVSLVASRTRGRGFKSNANNNMVTNRIVENKAKGRGPGPVTIENRRNNTAQHNEEHQLAHDMKQLNINDGSQYHQPARHNKGFFTSTNQHRSNTVPPRMQQQQQQQQQQQSHQQQTHSSQQTLQQQQQQQDSSGNRPKRYSSLRQRPTITETSAQQNYPSQHAQHGYFPPQGYPQSHFEQSSPVAPATAPMAGQPVISLPPGGQAASYAPPPFLVPPPQFIPPQTAPPSIINYVPGPNGPTFPPNFQGYQGYNPSVQPQGPPPPQELFQPQGCTYYSPAQQQQQQQQAAPLRRPKAAIPILPPPDNQQSGRGRGRSTQYQNNQSSSNTQQQTEQEAKSGNMVESDEKPVPGQFDSAQTEQPSTLNQESQKDQDMEIRTVNNIDQEVEMITNADSHINIDTSPIKKDNLDDSVSVKELLEATSNEKNTVSHSPTTLASVETELGNIESAIPESTIVEKAAA